MRKLVLLVTIGLIGAMMAAPASARQDKVSQCHYSSESNGYVLLSIAEAGLNGHDGHELDGAISDPVPNMPGFVFDADCQPEASGPDFLVRAVSIDSLGEVRVIAELLDTNDDGVPSSGDTAMFYEYPNDFVGIDYVPFTGTDCVIDMASTTAEREVEVGSSTDADCTVATWTGYDVAGEAYERFQLTFSDGTSVTQIDLLDNESFFASDWVRVNNISQVQVTSSTNDPWLEIEFGF